MDLILGTEKDKECSSWWAREHIFF